MHTELSILFGVGRIAGMLNLSASIYGANMRQHRRPLTQGGILPGKIGIGNRADPLLSKKIIMDNLKGIDTQDQALKFFNTSYLTDTLYTLQDQARILRQKQANAKARNYEVSDLFNCHGVKFYFAEFHENGFDLRFIHHLSDIGVMHNGPYGFGIYDPMINRIALTNDGLPEIRGDHRQAMRIRFRYISSLFHGTPYIPFIYK